MLTGAVFFIVLVQLVLYGFFFGSCCCLAIIIQSMLMLMMLMDWPQVKTKFSQFHGELSFVILHYGKLFVMSIIIVNCSQAFINTIIKW